MTPPSIAEGRKNNSNSPTYRLMSYGTVALFLMWPLVNFTIHNIAIIKASDVEIMAMVYGVCLALIVVALYLLESMFGRANATRFFLAASAVITVFFAYPQVMEAARRVFGFLGLGIAPHYGYGATFIGAGLLFLIFGNRALWMRVAFIFALVVVGVSFAEVALAVFDEPPPAATSSQGQDGENTTRKPPSPAQAPRERLAGKKSITKSPGGEHRNVYHLLVDAYGQNDQLKAVLNFDNSPFTDALAERGFRVLSAARTNYPNTMFSTSSIFSMGYPYQETDRFTNERKLEAVMAGANAVIRRTWKLGYRYIQVSGVSKCAEHPDVTCLKQSHKVFTYQTLETLKAIKNMTPLSYFVSIRGRSVDAVTVSDVQELAATIPSGDPFVLYAHTLAPHFPYTFRADCSNQAKIQINLSGGLIAKRYLAALQCVNKRLLAFSDFIIQRDPGAIVIFHSDHGSQFLSDWVQPLDAWTEKQFNERFGVLLAIRAPQPCLDTLSDNFSLVNLYRFVFSCLSGEAPEYLENRYFIVTGKDWPDYGRVYRYPN